MRYMPSTLLLLRTLRPPAASGSNENAGYLLRDRFQSAASPIVDGSADVGYRDVYGSGFFTASGRLRGGNTSEGKVVYHSTVAGEGYERVGGRTFCALVTPDDGEGDVSIWLAQTAGTLNGYGLRLSGRTASIIEPDGNEVPVMVGSGGTADPQRPITYLLGITLHATLGAIYWMSPPAAYSPDSEWALPAFPQARVLFISQLGTFATVYPTVRASSGFSYPGGVAFEDVRLLDVEDWADNGMALDVDTFDRADHASSLGAGWTADVATWGISGNKAYVASSAFNGRAFRSLSSPDVWVAAEVTSGSNLAGWFGLLLRRSASGTWMRLYNNGSANIYLQKFLSGGYDDQVFATYAAFSTSQMKRWLVGAKGDSFRLFLNGDETIIEPTTDSDSHHTEGTGFGLFGDSDYGQRWDNFAVYPVELTLPAALQAGTNPTLPTAGSTISSDTFTDTNGTGLASHTPDAGSGWTVHSGTWSVQSNRAECTAAQGFATVDAGVTNAKATVTVTMLGSIVSGVRAGLVLRWADSSNHVRVRMLEQGSSDEIEVEEVIAGVAAVAHKCYLGSKWANGASYVLAADVVGDELNVYLDGAIFLTMFLSSATLLTGTRFGLYRETGSDNTPFDAFSIAVAS